MTRRWAGVVGRLLWFPVCLSAVLWLGQGQLAIADTTLLFVIGALGLNLLFGNAGQFSLGSAAFLGIGAFAAAGATITLHLPFLLAVLAGGIASAIVGLVIGFPSLRLASHYLIFSTMALFFITVFVLQEIQGTNQTGYILPSANTFGVNLGFSENRWFVFLLLIVGLLIWVARNLTNSKIGRAWALIKEHQPAAAAMGIEVVRWRLPAFVVSSFFLGLGGAVGAFYLGDVSYANYSNINQSVVYILIVLLGGVGSVLGSVLGSATYVLLPYLTIWIIDRLWPNASANAAVTSSEWSIILFGAIVLIVLRFEPDGMAGALKKVALLFKRRILRRSKFSHLRDQDLVANPAAWRPVAEEPKSNEVHRVLEVEPVGSVLRISSLSVRYGDASPAVENISLGVGASSVVAILGPNGAGKTSLLRAVVGFDRAARAKVTADEIVYLGRDIRNYKSAGLFKQGLRFVPERDKVFRGLSVEANLGLESRGRKARAALMREIIDVFPKLDGIPLRQPAGTLSGGERQMLALASALVGDVQLLVLDEPSLGLAPIAIGQLLAGLNKLRERREISILMADQGVRLAREMADEIYLMAQGRIVDSGTKENWMRLNIDDAYLVGPPPHEAV